MVSCPTLVLNLLHLHVNQSGVKTELITSTIYGCYLNACGHQPIFFNQPSPLLSIKAFVNRWHPLIWASGPLIPVRRGGSCQQIIRIISELSLLSPRPSIAPMAMRPLERNDVIYIYLSCTGCRAACVRKIPETPDYSATVNADLGLTVAY